jgi:hypothetical protein
MLKFKAKNFRIYHCLSLQLMPVQIYNPFDAFNFSNRICFLTGQPVDADEERIQVFPQWLMSRYDLEEKPIKLLDESITTYKELKLPCATAINSQYFAPLEDEMSAAFDIGYDAVKQLDEQKLFQWAAKFTYGMIFNEMQAGIKLQHRQGEDFNISQSIIHKFSHLHMMLQSINKPIFLTALSLTAFFCSRLITPKASLFIRTRLTRSPFLSACAIWA